MPDTITTERLVLRPPVDADGPVVMAGLNDFDVVKWLANPPYPFREHDLRLRTEDGGSRWPGLAAIDHDGTMIGMVSGQPHLGFWLLKRAWGRGFATEAAHAMVRFVFENQSVNHLVSAYFDGNLGSERVLTKLGFRHVGQDTQWCQARQQNLINHNMRLNRCNGELAPC